MSVRIDQAKCVGCGKCIAVCPGNLIRKNEDAKAVLRCPGDCWNCASCMKECGVRAISLTIPPAFGGRGGELTIRRKNTITEWHIMKADGQEELLTTDTEEANQY